ncbi:esterase [Geodermatophilus sp. SYSU D00684]
MRRPLRLLLLPVATALAVTATAAPAGAAPPPRYPVPAPVEYFVDEAKLPFTALPGTTTTREWGVLDDGAGYRIEVPENWNGDLVVYAHGYRGTGAELTVSNPPERDFLVGQGYAWAASSYSENGYDPVSGVKSTHRLAQYFDATYGAPEHRYITGDSMGGHVIGVTIEQYRNQYDGALPRCGVMGDRRLFDFFLDYNLAAQSLADVPQVFPAPADYVATVTPTMRTELGISPAPTPSALTEAGQQLQALTELRSGGERPLAEAGFASFDEFLLTVHPQYPGYGEEPATKSVPGNADRVYQLDADPALSAAERELNAEVLRVQASPGGNGLSGVPTISGTFDVPVLSLHGLGDLFVPFSMEQLYAQDALAHGNGDLLVQRAIRSVGHCDFTAAERNQAFTDLVNWVENGVRPAGDDVLDPAVVADRAYGCRFTSGPHAGDADYARVCAAG